MTIQDPAMVENAVHDGAAPPPIRAAVLAPASPVTTPPCPSAISAARASDLYDLLVAGTISGGSAALTYIAYNTAFNGRWLLGLPDDPFGLKVIGLIVLAFGGFRIVAMAYDQSPTGGIMHRSREIGARSRAARRDNEGANS